MPHSTTSRRASRDRTSEESVSLELPGNGVNQALHRDNTQNPDRWDKRREALGNLTSASSTAST
jgi:hypothetical protein